MGADARHKCQAGDSHWQAALHAQPTGTLLRCTQTRSTPGPAPAHQTHLCHLLCSDGRVLQLQRCRADLVPQLRGGKRAGVARAGTE